MFCDWLCLCGLGSLEFWLRGAVHGCLKDLIFLSPFLGQESALAFLLFNAFNGGQLFFRFLWNVFCDWAVLSELRVVNYFTFVGDF